MLSFVRRNWIARKVLSCRGRSGIRINAIRFGAFGNTPDPVLAVGDLNVIFLNSCYIQGYLLHPSPRSALRPSCLVVIGEEDIDSRSTDASRYTTHIMRPRQALGAWDDHSSQITSLKPPPCLKLPALTSLTFRTAFCCKLVYTWTLLGTLVRTTGTRCRGIRPRQIGP